MTKESSTESAGEMYLGCKEKVDSPATISKPSELRETFPTLSLPTEQAKAFIARFGSPSLGDEYTMTIKARVKRCSQDTWGTSVEFDVTHILGDIVEEGEGECEGEEEGEKPDDSGNTSLFQRAKGKTKPKNA